MRYVLAIVIVFGLALGVYFLRTPEQDRFGVQDAGGQPQAAENTDQSDEAADNLETDGLNRDSGYASPASIAINWRPRPESALRWKDYPKTYDELRALAEAGDGHAAAMLARLLRECNFVGPPKTDAEIDAAIEEMRRTHKVTWYRDGVETIRDYNNRLESFDATIEKYEKTARKCSATTIEQRAEWENWAGLAMAMGSTDMLIHDMLYASMQRDDYSQLISDQWDAGDPTALFSLAEIHNRDYYQGENPSGQIWDYAYQRAILTLILDYYEEFDIPTDKDGLANFEEELSNQRRRMHAHEVREAEELAKEIIEKNQNCCLSWPGYIIDSE